MMAAAVFLSYPIQFYVPSSILLPSVLQFFGVQDDAKKSLTAGSSEVKKILEDDGPDTTNNNNSRKRTVITITFKICGVLLTCEYSL